MADTEMTLHPAVLERSDTMRMKILTVGADGSKAYKNLSIGAVNADATDEQFVKGAEIVEKLMDARVVEFHRVRNDQMGYTNE